ncbi:UDP-glucose dehydrogenase family protein [Campylobacter insulaenigrae]|uniref:UDP-glucose dehydrogenase family protein n=1 Tax=Campylobacter insulaenigrae TaxID=260714 RepID=UPI0021525797|nr:UDP-glucose/GDP-mannose dehydrogenase family protein [Campylobacter insulaenigrae]MCR6577144.1 UDP-glucose/GDP-mannose dehydrogenase family protein [Campylobacter insulaenigrae]
MNICIVGTGYVGLPSGACFAELGNKVTCVDIDEKKINDLNSGKIILYEEGLEDIFLKNLKNGNLKFSTSMEDGVSNADIVIIAVGTPPHPITKEADMKYIYAAAKEIAKYIKNYVVIATKSTVSVGTGDEIENIILKENKDAKFDVISLPEFLREGFAIYDFFNPDRIVVGLNSQKPRKIIEELYSSFKDKTNILFVNRKSSETIKYASNAFLAIKIHYINEMANFCEKVGADILEVASGMGFDSRIGNKFLNPGPGYGGSCFPKDTQAMAYMGKQNDIDLSLINSAINGNEKRKEEIANKIISNIKDIKNDKIAILGLAFKDGTDDCRESPAIDIILKLLNKNVNIKAFDPKAMEFAKSILKGKIDYASDIYDAMKDVSLLVILTEWREFKNIDLLKAYDLMKEKYILDFRNLLDKDKAIELGFKYCGVGR